MNAKQIEVHGYFKALYPKALVLYHLPGQYVVLGDDVYTAQKSITNIQILEDEVATMPDDIRMLSLLGADGTETHIVQYRNDDGVLDYPDVNRLKEEKDLDSKLFST